MIVTKERSKTEQFFRTKTANTPMSNGTGCRSIWDLPDLGMFQAPFTRLSPEPGQQGQTSLFSFPLFFSLPRQSMTPYMVKPKAGSPPGSENLGISVDSCLYRPFPRQNKKKNQNKQKPLHTHRVFCHSSLDDEMGFKKKFRVSCLVLCFYPKPIC